VGFGALCLPVLSLYIASVEGILVHLTLSFGLIGI
jgi:hypothetical protein